LGPGGWLQTGPHAGCAYPHPCPYPGAQRHPHGYAYPQAYRRAYLHHLDKCNEILGSQLNTIHNLYFYQHHMSAIREAIEQGRLASFAEEFYARQARGV